MKSQENHSDIFTLRNTLLDELKNKERIRTPRIEAAFRAVPRHLFVPGVSLEEVYADRAIPTKYAPDGLPISSSSQPAIMAIMLEQLGLEPGHKVLEIGAGTGYNAAMMAHIVGETGHVVTVDIDEDIVESAREHLAAAGFERVQVVCTDGGYGYADAAPYDRIILTVGAPDILPAWREQLKPDARLVLPLTIAAGQQSIAFEKTDNHLRSLSVHGCGFMKLRGAFAISKVQLGPDPGLMVEYDKEYPLDAEQVYGWLTGPDKVWETGVKLTLGEIIGRLNLWMSLYEPNVPLLVVRDSMLDRNIIPPLLIEGESKSVATGVLIGDDGMIVLMRPPGQPVPPDDWKTPFTLFVRQFGSDESLAQRFLEHIRAWDNAGRPPSKGLRVRVYQKETEYTSSAENELVIEKKWSKLVLDWPTIA